MVYRIVRHINCSFVLTFVNLLNVSKSFLTKPDCKHCNGDSDTQIELNAISYQPSLRGTSNNLIFPGDFEGMQKSAVGFARHDSYAYQTTGEAVVSGAATLCSSPGWLQTRNDMRSWRTRLAGTLVNVPWTDFQSQEAFADRRKVEYGRALCIQSNLVNYPDVNANAGNNDKDSRQVCARSSASLMSPHVLRITVGKQAVSVLHLLASAAFQHQPLFPLRRDHHLGKVTATTWKTWIHSCAAGRCPAACPSHDLLASGGQQPLAQPGTRSFGPKSNHPPLLRHRVESNRADVRSGERQEVYPKPNGQSDAHHAARLLDLRVLACIFTYSTRRSAGLVLPLPSNVEVARHIVPAVYRQCECPHIFRPFPLRAGPLAILPLLSIVPQIRMFSLKLSQSARA